MEQKQLDDVESSYITEEFIEEDDLLEELKKETPKSSAKKKTAKTQAKKTPAKTTKKSSKSKTAKTKPKQEVSEPKEEITITPVQEVPEVADLAAAKNVELAQQEQSTPKKESLPKPEQKEQPKEEIKIEKATTKAPKDKEPTKPTNAQQNEQDEQLFSSSGTWKLLGVFAVILILIAILTLGGNNTPGEDGPAVDMPELTDAMLGSPDAPLTIIEYSDFECPFCARFHADTYPQIKEAYIDNGKVNLIFRHFPLASHNNAKPAALAAACAQEQGEFWAYHDTLFENQRELSEQNYIIWAQELGLDVGQFSTCLDEERYAQTIAEHQARGRNAGVSGTPAFVVGDQLISGAQPFAVFEQVIEAQLANLDEQQEEQPTPQEPAEQETEQQDPETQPSEELEEPVEPEQPQEGAQEDLEPAAQTIELSIDARKWLFEPSTIVVSSGDGLDLTLNAQDLEFTFAIPELGIEQFVSTRAQVTTPALEQGEYEFLCSSCENWRGMTGRIIVE